VIAGLEYGVEGMRVTGLAADGFEFRVISLIASSASMENLRTLSYSSTRRYRS
jgi:hypothetical protein